MGKGKLALGVSELSSGDVLKVVLQVRAAQLDVYQIDYFTVVRSAQTYVALSCDTDGVFDGSYRFGFNGQMKTNEIAGVGNHNTALFWEYDTRLGRRWNLDPVVKDWESQYSCFSSNPISMSDKNGDDGVTAAAAFWLTQEASAAAAATGIGTVAVPFIEIIGGGIALWQLMEDVPVPVVRRTPPATPPAAVKRTAPAATARPVIQKADAKKVEEKVETKAQEKVKREPTATSRTKWEKANRQKWPKEPNDRSKNQTVSHKKPLQDGGTNEVENIEPMPAREHHQMHKNNGDFSRWAKDRWLKKNGG